MSTNAPRLAGTALRVAAALIETPGPSLALYRVATKQLGLDRIKEAQIPPETPAYTHLHLLQIGDGDE